MLRCKQCHKLGLFRTIDPNTGVCLECEQNNMKHPDTPREIIPMVSTIHVPRYYIGNGMRYIQTDSFDSVPVRVKQDLTFSALKLREKCRCDIENDEVSVFVNWDCLIGYLDDKEIQEMVRRSLNNKLPLFIQICGIDSSSKSIELCIGFYKIEKYDYSPDYDSQFDDIDFDDIAYC